MDGQRVLFLCTDNAARSPMAEALLRHHAADRFEAISAGLAPTELHPLARRVLEEKGIPTQDLRAKDVGRYLAKTTVHYAIVVCDLAEPGSPRVYPFAHQTLRWPIEDPVAFQGTPDEMLQKFRTVRDRIEEHLVGWLSEMVVTS